VNVFCLLHHRLFPVHEKGAKINASDGLYPHCFRRVHTSSGQAPEPAPVSLAESSTCERVKQLPDNELLFPNPIR
jgi:hypothetical protein